MINCRCPECKEVCRIYGTGTTKIKNSNDILTYYLSKCKKHGEFTVTERRTAKVPLASGKPKRKDRNYAW